jgi:hypothetical protein
MNNQTKLSSQIALALLLSVSVVLPTWATASEETSPPVVKIRPLPGNVDIAFVVDDTKSMQPEIQRLAGSISHFLDTLTVTKGTPPQFQLITFDNHATSQIITADTSSLLKEVEKLNTSNGPQCAKAAVDALVMAAQNLKNGGIILLATHSAPKADADLNSLKDLLINKNIRLQVLLTGDCQAE